MITKRVKPTQPAVPALPPEAAIPPPAAAGPVQKKKKKKKGMLGGALRPGFLIRKAF